ncbi:microsomal glutathione S-transferase 2-like [Alosa sapidissima]|uniref:microsomal glutathione S-transferase 2-like n=1 Tax=Alosa sapidissima TaxID=34773 RepID=UPI001C09F96D|nr:microsomal glutathione S-transferase 2-like [Alosa sapidissima]
MDMEIPFPLGAVTLVSALHTAYVARLLWKRWAAPTVMTGALKEQFERTLKAHKKCIAFYPIFLVILWTSGLFFNEELAAVLGGVYILGRHIYSCGQSSMTKIRHFLGFYTVITAVLLLSLTGTLGLLHVILDPLIDINHLLSYLYGEPKQFYFF